MLFGPNIFCTIRPEVSDNTAIMSLADSAEELPVYTIVVEPPDTAANFTLFNIPCDVLDSDFLMQPVNEADYDSETQACVDTRERGSKASFYDHYVTKRRKKKGVKGCGIESPAPASSKSKHLRVHQTSEEAVLVASSTDAKEVSISSSCSTTAVPSVNARSAMATAGSGNVSLGMPRTVDLDHLTAPSLLGTTSGVSKGALQNAAVRRIACGRMPPQRLPETSPSIEDANLSK